MTSALQFYRDTESSQMYLFEPTRYTFYKVIIPKKFEMHGFKTTGLNAPDIIYDHLTRNDYAHKLLGNVMHIQFSVTHNGRTAMYEVMYDEAFPTLPPPTISSHMVEIDEHTLRMLHRELAYVKHQLAEIEEEKRQQKISEMYRYE